MEGLTPRHHEFLNGLVDKTLEERRQIYKKFRKICEKNPLALEQIDIYDRESPYVQHVRFYLDAFKSRNAVAIEREEAWFAKHYPLTTKKETH